MKSSHQDGASFKVLAPNVRTESHTSPNFTKRMENLEGSIVTNCGLFAAELNSFLLLGSVSNLKKIRLEHVLILILNLQFNGC